jgi:hypothetical protein
MTFADIASLITAVAALGGVLMGFRNSRKIQEVHLSINSRMDQLLLATKESAHAAGVNEEKAKNIPEQTITVPEQTLKVQ